MARVEKEPAYAILRFDARAGSHHEDVTVTRVVWSLDRAVAEVDRLNAVNADKGCRYEWQTTRAERRP